VETLIGIVPKRCYVDRGYRGHDANDTAVYLSGQKRGVTKAIARELRRRSAIEPEIGT
jgi:IS5 family transposase